nr:hypothetical protein [uncultured Albidiferax sp.]
MPALIQQLYRRVREGLSDGTPITLLHIGEEQTAVAVGSGPEVDTVLLLALGTRSTAAQFYRQQPPTPGELENAIQWGEDEVNRARALVVGYPSLFSSDPAVLQMAGLAGVTGGSMSVEAVEGLFDLLASLSLGRPASSAGIPNTPAFAAGLLILREFMHHLGFAEIRWQA